MIFIIMHGVTMYNATVDYTLLSYLVNKLDFTRINPSKIIINNSAICLVNSNVIIQMLQ